MYLPNLKFVALPVPEIIKGTRKIWAVPGYDHAPFSAKFFMGFYSDGPCEWLRLRTLILGKGGRRGSEVVPFERALVSSYRPSIVAFHLSVRVSEILPLLCSSTIGVRANFF